MSCEETAKILDELKYELEYLLSEIKTTLKFQELVMQNFEREEPSTDYMRCSYLTTMTMGEVLFDRLKNTQKDAKALVDKIYCMD